MRRYSLFLLFLFIVQLIACQSAQNKEQTNERSSPNPPKKPKETLSTNDSLSKIIIDTTSNRRHRKPEISFDYAKSLQKALPEWVEYQQIKNAEFEATNFEFSHEAALNPQAEAFAAPSDFWDLYQDYLPQSPSRNIYLDIYSKQVQLVRGEKEQVNAQISPDKEVALIDKDKKQRRSLLFFGSSTLLDDAYWLNAKELIIVGGQDTPKGKYVPMLWYLNLEKGLYRGFVYQDSFPRAAHYYLKEKFDKVNF